MSDPDPLHDDHKPEIYERNARTGLALFCVYLALYGGFVYLNAFRSDLMGQMFWGVNLALWYGMGLIAAAFLISLVYMFLCRKK